MLFEQMLLLLTIQVFHRNLLICNFCQKSVFVCGGGTGLNSPLKYISLSNILSYALSWACRQLPNFHLIHCVALMTFQWTALSLNNQSPLPHLKWEQRKHQGAEDPDPLHAVAALSDRTALSGMRQGINARLDRVAMLLHPLRRIIWSLQTHHLFLLCPFLLLPLISVHPFH